MVEIASYKPSPGTKQSLVSEKSARKQALCELLGGCCGLLMGMLSLSPAHAQSAPIRQATVTEILDSPQVFIQEQQVPVNAIAQLGERIRTGAARANLFFRPGAVGRMTRNSVLTVGQQCPQLQRGTLLISGKVNACTPFVITGVRGTTYLIEVDATGQEQVKVFEGEVSIGQNSYLQTAPKQLGTLVTLRSGEKITIGETGAIGNPAPITQAEFTAFLTGELLNGFQEPLPTLDQIQKSFGQLFPGVPIPGVPARAPQQVSALERRLCESTMAVYRQNLRIQTNGAWKPPAPPHTGVWAALLKYEVTRNGKVQNIQVIQSSGYEPLDKSAIARVANLESEFRPFPSCYDKDSLEVEHSFRLLYQ